MPAAPIPENESRRLHALRCTGILDTLPEDSFEHIVDLAKTLFNCPVALVSMIDEDRQWFKAKRGFDDVEGPRDVAFCAHAILQDESLWVEDARQDARFADNPQVTGAPHLRFYAGAPIVLACGARVGTVAVVDLAPRAFDPVLAKNLQALADLAADQLRSRTVMQTLDDTNRQLKMEQAKTVSTLTAMTEGVIVQNAKGQITFCNPAAEQILGLSRDQLRGLTSTDPRWRAIHEDGRDFPGSTHPATMALKTGLRQRNVTMGIELPSGERRWLLVNAEPIFDYIVNTEPSRVVATFTDITEARQTRQHLIEAKKLAEAADQAKSEFLANMSHELRTPMNGVVSMANALLETDLSDRQREMVDIIVRSGGSLERLLSEILDLSKIQSEQFELRPELTDIHHLIQDLTELYGARAEEKGLCVKTAVDENVSGTFETDPVRLRQMMANLLANAIKFTETGCVCVEASLETLKGQEALRFAVKDTGIGFSEQIRQDLFQRFTQADGSITRRYGGTGLGLAITQALCDRMGGHIDVQSQEHKGSTFTLVIPLNRIGGVVTPPVPDDDVSHDRPQLKILVAEDNPTNQKVLQIVLESYEHDITMVENGQLAVEAHAREPFDLIIMDMQMPVMDGVTATQAIRAAEQGTGRHTPLAMLSANAMAHHVQAALEAGADQHIAKPFTPKSLCEGLRATLACVASKDSDEGTTDATVRPIAKSA